MVDPAGGGAIDRGVRKIFLLLPVALIALAGASFTGCGKSANTIKLGLAAVLLLLLEASV